MTDGFSLLVVTTFNTDIFITISIFLVVLPPTMINSIHTLEKGGFRAKPQPLVVFPTPVIRAINPTIGLNFYPLAMLTTILPLTFINCSITNP